MSLWEQAATEGIPTWEVNSKPRLGDVKVRLKLNGDNVESGVDSLRQQRTTDLLQQHLVLRRPIPYFQDVMRGLCVKCKKLETEKGTFKRKKIEFMMSVFLWTAQNKKRKTESEKKIEMSKTNIKATRQFKIWNSDPMVLGSFWKHWSISAKIKNHSRSPETDLQFHQEMAWSS